MKRPLLFALLAGSLGANAGLLHLRFRPATARLEPVVAASAETGEAPASRTMTALAAAWQPGADLRKVAAQLRASGLPDHLVRGGIMAAIDERFRARETALRPPRKNLKFWQAEEVAVSWQTKLAELDLRREKAAARDTALGADPAADSRYDHLPAEKRARARRVTEDYDTMLAALRADAGLLPLAAEREKIQYLEAERERDLAALLTPDELREHNARTSLIADRIRDQLRYFEATPAEFSAIFAAQSEIVPMTMLLPGADPARPSTRVQDETKSRLDYRLKATLGEARYSEYMRSKDFEFQQLSDLVLRAGQPLSASHRVFDVRANVAAESQRILTDTTLDLDQKVAAAQALAASTRSQIEGILGPQVAEPYLRNLGRWLTAVEQGSAVTFTENGMSVRAFNQRGRGGPAPVTPPPR